MRVDYAARSSLISGGRSGPKLSRVLITTCDTRAFGSEWDMLSGPVLTQRTTPHAASVLETSLRPSFMLKSAAAFCRREPECSACQDEPDMCSALPLRFRYNQNVF